MFKLTLLSIWYQRQRAALSCLCPDRVEYQAPETNGCLHIYDELNPE